MQHTAYFRNQEQSLTTDLLMAISSRRTACVAISAELLQNRHHSPAWASAAVQARGSIFFLK
jgi:hypothetical protein